MDVALVEHAEHDVHRDERRENEHRLVLVSEASNAAARSLERGSFECSGGICRSRVSPAAIASDRLAQGIAAPCAKLNEIVHYRELALVVDRERPRLCRPVRKGGQGRGDGCGSRARR